MLQPRIGTVIFGRYALRRELARGGMGSVWSAQDKRLRRQVAIKLLVPWAHSTKEMHARFEREAMAVAQLSSPHVVRIFDYGIDGETPFIVMELLAGEDLKARLKRRRRLTLNEAGRVLVQTSKALSEAHDGGIIHRDLKPGNLFLVRSQEEESIKVLDFGTAKATSSDISSETTKAGEILGTPQYMSPEQALAFDTIDHRTDLWSLGVITYRTLTGRLPFKGKSAADTILQICGRTASPPSKLVDDLPAELDDFFVRALAREPEDRFQSASEMVESFAAIARDLLPAHTPPRVVAPTDDDDDEAPTVFAPRPSHRANEALLLASASGQVAGAINEVDDDQLDTLPGRQTELDDEDSRTRVMPGRGAPLPSGSSPTAVVPDAVPPREKSSKVGWVLLAAVAIIALFFLFGPTDNKRRPARIVQPAVAAPQGEPAKLEAAQAPASTDPVPVQTSAPNATTEPAVTAVAESSTGTPWKAPSKKWPRDKPKATATPSPSPAPTPSPPANKPVDPFSERL